MTKPTVAAVIFTYGGSESRRQYAHRCTESLLAHLRYDGPLRYHVADDGSPDGHADTLVSLIASRGHEVTVTDARRGGYGRSYNLATQTVHQFADAVVAVEDDWELMRDLDLGPLVDALGEIGCIRMGYLGFTREGGLGGILRHVAGATYLMLDPSSDEPHVAAGHPRIESIDYQRSVGAWTEGLAAGATEFDWCQRHEARIGVAWPMDLVRAYGDLFVHIGTESVNGIVP